MRAQLGENVGALQGVMLIACALLLVACKSSSQNEQEEQLRARPATIQRARAAADKSDWSAALDALDAAAAFAPLSADETQLHTLWQFRKVLDLYCAGKVDDLTASDLYQVPTSVPSGLDPATLAKANQLIARRDLIVQLRDLRKKQQDLSEQAKPEPTTSEECDTAIRAVQSARTVTLNIVRRRESDYGPGIYDVQDSTGQTAQLTTTDSTFTTTGLATITAYAFDDRNIIELSAERRAKAQACLDDRQKAEAARAEFATSSKILDAKIAAMSSEFAASCAAPTPTANSVPPPPVSPVATPNPPDTVDASQSTPPSVPVPATERPTAVASGNCTSQALNCAQFSSQGRVGRRLHELVFAAEQAGRHTEAICLALPNLNASDKWLAGAANFDSARAWDGLGCHDQAVAAIEASLAVRPRDQGGWKETCEECGKIGGTCSACGTAAAGSDALVGKWTGTVITTNHDPEHTRADKPTTTTDSFEIVRKSDGLVRIGKDAMSGQPNEWPLVLTSPGNGVLVDHADSDAEVTTYTLQGDQLEVETDIKGRYGWRSSGTFKRAK